MHPDLTYVFNDRHYRLTQDNESWQMIYEHPGTSPVIQEFAEFEIARRVFWRRIACTILLNARRLRGADIDGTLVALVADVDGRLHVAHHGPPDTDRAESYTDRITAFTAWRDACWQLAHQATFTVLPTAVTDEAPPTVSAIPGHADT